MDTDSVGGGGLGAVQGGCAAISALEGAYEVAGVLDADSVADLRNCKGCLTEELHGCVEALVADP